MVNQKLVRTYGVKLVTELLDLFGSISVASLMFFRGTLFSITLAQYVLSYKIMKEQVIFDKTHKRIHSFKNRLFRHDESK